MESPVLRFQDTFRRLNKHTLNLLDALYAGDVVFRDPLHEIRGLERLRAYFANQYENAQFCTFEFHDEFVRDGAAMVTWTMRLRHARLDGGREFAVPGSSLIRFAERVTFHQDYFDLGAMIYERLPVLRTVIARIKRLA